MAEQRDFRILIIDDNKDIHEDFIKILTDQQASSKLKGLGDSIFGDNQNKADLPLPRFKIDTASQGQEGYEQIKKAYDGGQPYALAFVDVRMPPGWDGIETIKRIWEIDNDIQVVICTAYSDYSWEETVGELGDTDNLLILKKPFDSTSVRQLACSLTKKWRLMQDNRDYTASLEGEIKERTQELEHLATHDPLTGLPNRSLLEDNLRRAIESSAERDMEFALLFIDLDRFKLVNDSLSHAAGDELLNNVGLNIKATLQDDDSIARIGGDEFVVVLTGLQGKRNLDERALNVLDAISSPMQISGHTLEPTGSIGIATYPQDGKSIDELIRGADAAMYDAKKHGGNQYQFYKSSMNEDNLQRLKTEEELRKAVISNELFLVYQPVYSAESGELVAAEALIRWQHPEKGVVLPKDFIPIAEESNLISQIGKWVFVEVCRQNKAWQEAGCPPIRVALNVASRQLQDEAFVDFVEQTLNETGLEPKYIEIELNEHTVITSPYAKSVIEKMKQIGVRVAIDDFGTGNSSLSYIRNLPLDLIKIDRSFVSNIKESSSDEVIIKAIIAMAQALQLEVIAEGVESASQREFLRDEKCDKIQGYYLNNPLFADEFKEILSSLKEKVKEDESS